MVIGGAAVTALTARTESASHDAHGWKETRSRQFSAATAAAVMSALDNGDTGLRGDLPPSLHQSSGGGCSPRG